jgi:hypothetical protein
MGDFEAVIVEGGEHSPWTGDVLRHDERACDSGPGEGRAVYIGGRWQLVDTTSGSVRQLGVYGGRDGLQGQPPGGLASIQWHGERGTSSFGEYATPDDAPAWVREAWLRIFGAWPVPARLLRVEAAAEVARAD